MCVFGQLEAFLAPQEIRLIELSSEKFKSTGDPWLQLKSPGMF